MKNKLKQHLLWVYALIGISSFSVANATDAWSTSNLNSYVAGSQVTDNGKTYKCKGCQLLADVKSLHINQVGYQLQSLHLLLTQ